MSHLLDKNTSSFNIGLLRCEPETWIAPETLANENIHKYTPDGPDHLDDGVYLSHWKSNGEPEPPPVIQDPYPVSSTGHTYGESCREQFDSSQTGLRGNSQQVPWSSLSILPETYTPMSQYQPHGTKYHGYHTGQYTPLSTTTAITYNPPSQTRDGEGLWSGHQSLPTRDINDGSSIEGWHFTEGGPVWLSTQSQNDSDVHRSADLVLPAHDFHPLTHHRGIGNPRSSNESSTLDGALQTHFHRTSQSTSQNPYTLAHDSQPFIARRPEEKYEDGRWEH